MARVFIVSDHQLVRAGLSSLVVGTGEHEVVGEATLANAVAEIEGGRVDAAVVELGSDVELAEELSRLLAEHPDLPVIMVGQSASALAVRQALQAGARAFLLWDASAEDLAATISAVRQGLVVLHPTAGETLLRADVTPFAGPSGGEALSPREAEVLTLLAQGLPSKTIAQRLRLSEHTVKFHIGSILAKLGASSRTEAVTIALRRGLIAL